MIEEDEKEKEYNNVNRDTKSYIYKLFKGYKSNMTILPCNNMSKKWAETSKRN